MALFCSDNGIRLRGLAAAEGSWADQAQSSWIESLVEAVGGVMRGGDAPDGVEELGRRVGTTAAGVPLRAAGRSERGRCKRIAVRLSFRRARVSTEALRRLG
jgi:hypothetical protein